MSQWTLIILCAFFMGIVGFWSTWISVDVVAGLGTYLVKRKERKLLEAEAKALEKAEAEGGVDDEAQ